MDRQQQHRPWTLRHVTSAVVSALILAACVFLVESSEGGNDELAETKRKEARELIRRQEGIANIEQALVTENAASRRALKLLLSLAPVPSSIAAQLRSSAVNGTAVGTDNIPTSDSEAGRNISSNATLAGNLTSASNLTQAQHNHQNVSANVTNGTSANRTAARNRSASRVEDAYAAARAMFRQPPPDKPTGVRLKEQEVNEYTKDVIKCFPTDDNGEVTAIEHSASFCWYHPRYCQLLCQPHGQDGYSPVQRYNDKGTPRGNAWSQWKATLKKLSPRA